MADANGKPCVLVYRRKILPPSETFIKRQILSLKTWRAVLVGKPQSSGLSLDGLEVMAMPRLKQRRHRGIGGFLSRFFAADTERSPRKKAEIAARMLRKQAWFAQVRALNPQIVHVHFGTNAAEAWPLAIALGIPMVVTLHGYDVGTYPSWWESGQGGAEEKTYPETLRALAAAGTRFIAVSEHIRECALQYGIPPESVQTIPIGISVEAFSPGDIPVSQRPPRILFVGRFVEKKGIENLIQAFSAVKRKLPEAELRLVGEGKLEPALMARAERLGLEVDFTGWLPQERILEEFHHAKVLCAPSVRAANGDYDGLPVVIFEAQACGLPVVTSAKGGLEGILDGVTGAFVPEGDVEALAAALIRYLEDSGLSEKASIAAREFAAEQLDISRHSLTLEDLYRELSSGKAAASH